MAFVLMKIFEEAPRRFDRWMNILTLGKLQEVRDEVAAKLIRPNAAVLEIGCGTGALLEMLAEQGARVTGIDTAEGMIEEAQRRLEEAGFSRETNVKKLHALQVEDEFEPGTFDQIVSVLAFSEMSDDEISECLTHYRVPTDRPLVVQVSRFDRWKDPMGVIEAFRKAREQVDCTLVLVGNNAVDDPEGDVILETIHSSADERVIVLTADDPTLVNALQRHAAVVLQKSIREGFGLTVTEAMWKGAAVIGGNVGGIRHQIKDGENGFLVNSVDEAAERIVQTLKDPRLREQLGSRARETVRQKYLMSRLVEDWLDLLSMFDQRATS